jgi:hypothetical protein
MNERMYLAQFESVESLGTLRGRLEGCMQERDALRAQVNELMDQRETLVKMLQHAIDDGAGWRRRWEEADALREAGGEGLERVTGKGEDDSPR